PMNLQLQGTRPLLPHLGARNKARRTAHYEPDSRATLPPLAKGGSKARVVRRLNSVRRRREVCNPRFERARAERRGSVLIVVIGMLLLFMLIGITFFTFANQEHSSAEYYADSAKVFSDASDNSLFDLALEQLIIGPHDDNVQSVLYPGRYSLVPNMIGMFGTNPNGANLATVPLDRHPYNGGLGSNTNTATPGHPPAHRKITRRGAAAQPPT